MANTPPPSPLGALLLIATVVQWAMSPSKWQTFKKMAIAALSAAILVIVLGLGLSMAGYGAPEFYGEAAVIIAVISALIMGRQHVRQLKRARTNLPTK